MKWAIHIVRTLLGLIFLIFGANYFLTFLEMPPMPDGVAKTYLFEVMFPTKYLEVVKVLEVIGGALLVTRLLVPLGIVILVPIIVNILLFELLLLQKPGIAVAMSLMAVFLIYGYWPYFSALFTISAKEGR